MLTIGCHLSAAGGYEHMAKEAEQIGANTFAFFTRNPRGGKSKALDENDIEAFYKRWLLTPKGKLVAHAPYTLNPCSAKEYVREFARNSMKEDLERMEYTPGNYYNFHPGSHVGQGTEAGIEMICEVLNEVMWGEQQTTVLLETMAGKGSEIGGRFEELSRIIEGVKFNGKNGQANKIGVCLDTCHVSDAGYDSARRIRPGHRHRSPKSDTSQRLEKPMRRAQRPPRKDRRRISWDRNIQSCCKSPAAQNSSHDTGDAKRA